MWQTLKRTVAEFREDNLTDWAAALTYYAVLAIFPALLALVSVVGLVGDPDVVTDALTEFVTEVGPESAAETFAGPIESLTRNRATAGALLVVSVAVALGSASGYVGAFIRASNVIYETREGRPFWKLRPLQLAITLACVLLVALAFLAVVATGPVAEALGKALGISDQLVDLWHYLKWPLLLFVVLVVIGILYYASPNARLPSFKLITPGAATAVGIWILASGAFAFYVSNFGRYDKTYGTLGGVITFLIWLWLSNLAVLLGAELNAEIERTRQLEHGLPAERELQLPPRDDPDA